jgi:hypothetical protein
MNSNQPLASVLPSLPPTSRLILTALAHVQAPMTIVGLCVATGSTSTGTVEKLVRQLVKDGHLIRTSSGVPPLFYLSEVLAQ